MCVEIRIGKAFIPCGTVSKYASHVIENAYYWGKYLTLHNTRDRAGGRGLVM